MHSVVFDELKPMPPAGYTEVITGPARRASAAGRRLTIEPALVERLLAETAEGADALPLLALTLERLYRDFGDDGDLTVAEYESMGGMAQVVQTEVDKLLAADPEQRQAQLDTLHDAFIPWLATINPDNDQPMRRLARWDDLPAASHPLIQAMVEKRLLVKDTRDGQTVVEVALESLLRQWRELAAWLRDEAQDLKDADSPGARRRRLAGQRAQRILAAGRHPAGRGRNPGGQTRLPRPPRPHPRLPARLPGAGKRPHRGRETTPGSRTPSRAQQHAAALRKRSRILIAVLAVTAIIAVVAVILGVQANHARKQADSAVSARPPACGWSPRPSQCWPVPVPAAKCARTNSCLRRDDWRKPRMTVHCSMCCPRRSTSSRSPKRRTAVYSVAFSPDGHRIVSGVTTRRCGCGTPTPANRSARR